MAIVPAPPPWRDWPVTTRVMIRRHIEDSQHKYTDLLGVILRSDDEGLLLETRTGEEFVPAEAIFQGKPIPPAPPRRRPRHQPAFEDDSHVKDSADPSGD